MDFTEQKNQIRTMLEKGDIAEIVKKSGMSRQTVQTAHRKCCLNEMSPGERKAWEVTISYLSEKQKKIEAIGKQTAKLSAKID